MIRIALTGNIASGKSKAEEILSSMGYKVLDTDKAAHSLLDCEELHTAFKDFDVFENDKISRVKLGKLVFNNKELKQKLESIIHPQIKKIINEFFMSNSDDKYLFVGIPLLFEAKMESMFDKIVLIYSDDNIRLERLMKRDNYDKEYAKKRMNCQLSQEEKLQKSDVIIYNNSTIENLKSQVLKLVE